MFGYNSPSYWSLEHAEGGSRVRLLVVEGGSQVRLLVSMVVDWRGFRISIVKIMVFCSAWG